MGGSLTTSDNALKHEPALMQATLQESLQSPETESQPQPRTSFSSLPLELRQKIWLLTLQPRVLCLHIHQRLEPPHYNEDGFIDGFRKTVSVNFTAQTATPSLLPSAVFSEYANYVAPDSRTLDIYLGNKISYNLRYEKVLATRPLSVRNSRGPVALEVCSESREVAMKRYELAFAGTNLALEAKDKKEWDKKAFGEKKIWVDFEQDIIVVDAMWRPLKYSKCAPLRPLGLLRRYALEDSRKIRRLALGTASASVPGSGGIMVALLGKQIPMGVSAPKWHMRWEWFWVSIGLSS